MAEAVKVAEQPFVRTFKETNYFAQGTYKRDYVDLFTTATIANMITKTVLAPLERWRIIKQTQMTYELRPKKIASFGQYLQRVRSEQGWTALWRGNSANLWLHGWQVLAQVCLFDTIKSTFHQFAYQMQNEPISKFALQKVAAPLIASASTLIITHPIDTARIRLSMNYFRNPREMLFSGITSCWSYIRLEERSAKGIYRGFFMANLIALLHLNIFTTARSLYQQLDLSQSNEIVDILASKESIGALASLILLHPLDTLKKNLQLNNQGKPILFKNSLHVFAYLKQYSGVMSMYQGLTVTVIRHLLFCPIFAVVLDQLNKNVRIF